MSLSVTIICLNEEEYITQALSYAATIADEIIVVDGGSTDGTVARLREFQSEHMDLMGIILHDMPDSFSKQRNLSIAGCTGDWILHLDADEKYTRRMSELVKTLDDVPPNIIGFSFPTWYLAEDERHYQNVEADPHIRLFRNRPDIRYVRPVHEHIALDGVGLIAHPSHFTDLERAHIMYLPEIHLLHYGSLRSDRAYEAWRGRWERFAAKSLDFGINVDALVRHPQAIGEIPERELP